MEQHWLAPALIGAVASYLFGGVRVWQTNTQRALGLLRGILIEIDRAEECASTYIREAASTPVWTPAYRVEIDFLRTGVGALMELRALTSLEVAAIHRLYISSSEVNRCLESLARMYEHAPPQPQSETMERISRRAGFPINQGPAELSHQMRAETGRTTGKCQHVLDEVPKARAAATAALDRIAWLESQD